MQTTRNPMRYEARNQPARENPPKLILPVHLAVGIRSYPGYRLRCVPEKLPAAVALMLKFNHATTNEASVTCPRCLEGGK